jgi:hypoxanthine phosphoribosyltransferase
MRTLVHIHDLSFAPFISETTIQTRVKELAAQLDAEYAGKNPIFLAVLNGAFMFAADLFKQLTCQPELSFVKVSSYVGTQSSGRDRHVVIIEDILDTGVTMDKIGTLLQSEQPASLAVCALLLKPASYKGKHQPQYIGFEIEDRFVVGYGLDYKELGRELPAVYQLIN